MGTWNLLGAAFTTYALIAGGVDTGWTFYTPFSTMFSNTHVVLAVVAVVNRSQAWYEAGARVATPGGSFHE